MAKLACAIEAIAPSRRRSVRLTRLGLVLFVEALLVYVRVPRLHVDIIEVNGQWALVLSVRLGQVRSLLWAWGQFLVFSVGRAWTEIAWQRVVFLLDRSRYFRIANLR